MTVKKWLSVAALSVVGGMYIVYCIWSFNTTRAFFQRSVHLRGRVVEIQIHRSTGRYGGHTYRLAVIEIQDRGENRRFLANDNPVSPLVKGQIVEVAVDATHIFDSTWLGSYREAVAPDIRVDSFYERWIHPVPGFDVAASFVTRFLGLDR